MIYLEEPNIDAHDIYSVVRCLKSGQVSTRGKLVDEFERRMADFLGVSDCVATCSGTAALQLALMAAGIGQGDKVVVPALTFIGTANAVKAVGAEPVFVDVDRKTWVLEHVPGGFEYILPVDLYGNPCGNVCVTYAPNPFMPKMVLPTRINDSAEALGSHKYGANGTCIYSFNGNKTMTTGGGGLVVGGDLDKVRQLAEQGKYQSIGFNYRMPALNAALGLAQLDRLPEFIAKKKRINEIYRNELDGLVKFQEATPGSDPCWWYTACLFDRPAASVAILIHKRGVPTRYIFEPLPSIHAYCEAGFANKYPNAEFIWRYGQCLPSSTLNSEQDILTVCKAIKEVV